MFFNKGQSFCVFAKYHSEMGNKTHGNYIYLNLELMKATQSNLSLKMKEELISKFSIIADGLIFIEVSFNAKIFNFFVDELAIDKISNFIMVAFDCFFKLYSIYLS